jgi:predicted transposase/invertase (TIGR01784 family)
MNRPFCVTQPLVFLRGLWYDHGTGTARRLLPQRREEAKEGTPMREEQRPDFNHAPVLDAHIALPPLADPVFTKLFQNVEVGGLAMKELLNATLGDSGDVPIGDILSLMPQKIHSDTSERAYRIDVEAVTVKGEAIIMEVQLGRFASMIERDLLYSEQTLVAHAKVGTALKDVILTMPRVVVLNILDFDLRVNGRNFHQVAELTYREEPRERATDKFEIHNLELKKFRRIEPDLRKPLHCWLTAVCKAQDEQKSLKEVVELDARLEEYYRSNPGFAQFTDRHALVSAEPEVRRDYRRWQYEQMVNALERDRLAKENEAKGRAEGEAKGKAERDLEIALRVFEKRAQSASFAEISQMLGELGISESTIETARKQYEEGLSQ